MQQSGDRVEGAEAFLHPGLERRLGGAHLLQFGLHGIDLRSRHDDDAVAVADDEVAGVDDDAGERDRQADGSRSVARRRVRADSGAGLPEPRYGG